MSLGSVLLHVPAPLRWWHGASSGCSCHPDQGSRADNMGWASKAPQRATGDPLSSDRNLMSQS